MARIRDQRTQEEIRAEAAGHYLGRASRAHSIEEKAEREAEGVVAMELLDKLLATAPGELFAFKTFAEQRGGADALRQVFSQLPYFSGSLGLLDMEFVVPDLNDLPLTIEQTSALWYPGDQAIELQGQTITAKDVAVRFRRTAIAGQPT